MSDNSIDTIITDPPYGLKFMGKKWDYEIPPVAHFSEMFRIVKPGATLLCFGGTRTWHRIAVNIEDAGWDIFDNLYWCYGSGFPKSLAIGKAIDKMQGNERQVAGKYLLPNGKEWNLKQAKDSNIDHIPGTFTASGTRTLDQTKGNSEWEGWGTALKPAVEPIIVARKKCEGTYAENALKWGVAGLNIDDSRIEGEPWKWGTQTDLRGGGLCTKRPSDGHILAKNIKSNPNGRFPSNLILSCACESEHEDNCPVRIMDEQSGTSKSTIDKKNHAGRNGTSTFAGDTQIERMQRGDIGGASRFFYCAKASKSERNNGCEDLPDKLCGTNNKGYIGDGIHDLTPRNVISKNHHPTVKPLKLMEYLCTLTKTPTGGIVLDPYMGSGTTGIACALTGRSFIGIEREQDFYKIAQRRIDAYGKQQRLFDTKGDIPS